MNKSISKDIVKPKKKLTKIQEEIVKLNRKFNKAKPFEKRMIIAQDVINQLKIGKYESIPGNYCKFNKILKKGDLQKNLLRESVSCKVCAIGGMFTSSIRINDKFKLKWDDISISDAFMRPELEKYFSKEQLLKIEEAYEGWDNGYFRDKKGLEEYNKKDEKELLKKIMENIIKNKGTFRPTR